MKNEKFVIFTVVEGERKFRVSWASFRNLMMHKLAVLLCHRIAGWIEFVLADNSSGTDEMSAMCQFSMTIR